MVAKLDHPCTAAAQQNAGSPPLNCPRCDSTNTKFCYYNNYSLAQPRHFCKSCKRYWTRGGTLRNVPVGGGCRKNKRPKKSHRSAPITPASLPPHPLIPISPAADLGSLLYGFPSMIDSSANFFPKFEIDDQLAPPGYEDGFTSCLQQPAADFVGDYNSLLSRSQIPSSSPPVAAEEYQQPMLQLPHDDDDRLNGTWSGSTMINWRVGKETQSFAAGQPSSSYVLWNQAMSGGWQESGSSVAPLI